MLTWQIDDDDDDDDDKLLFCRFFQVTDLMHRALYNFLKKRFTGKYVVFIFSRIFYDKIPGL